MISRINSALAARRAALKDGDKGFTLIELLVVVIIIGILAAIAIPVFLNQRQKGWDAAVTSDLRNAATAEETHLTENNVHTASTADLLAAGLKSSATASNYSGGTAGLTITLPVDAESYCLACHLAVREDLLLRQPQRRLDHERLLTQN